MSNEELQEGSVLAIGEITNRRKNEQFFMFPWVGGSYIMFHYLSTSKGEKPGREDTTDV